ncbi:ribonuclease H2, subunit B, partial [Elysia marginata]
MAPPTRRQSSKESIGEGKKQQTKKVERMETKERDQWMCIMHDDLINGQDSEDGQQPSILKLKHPRTSLGTLYVMSADESALYQLHNFKEKYRSWFIGNKVCSDGSLYLTSPMDPLFLLLPYLMADE